MPPILWFFLSRLIAIPVTVFIVTAVLYAITMQSPPEVRAQLYLARTERLKRNIFDLLDPASQ